MFEENPFLPSVSTNPPLVSDWLKSCQFGLQPVSPFTVFRSQSSVCGWGLILQMSYEMGSKGEEVFTVQQHDQTVANVSHITFFCLHCSSVAGFLRVNQSQKSCRLAYRLKSTPGLLPSSILRNGLNLLVLSNCVMVTSNDIRCCSTPSTSFLQTVSHWTVFMSACFRVFKKFQKRYSEFPLKFHITPLPHQSVHTISCTYCICFRFTRRLMLFCSQTKLNLLMSFFILLFWLMLYSKVR